MWVELALTQRESPTREGDEMIHVLLLSDIVHWLECGVGGENTNSDGCNWGLRFWLSAITFNTVKIYSIFQRIINNPYLTTGLDIATSAFSMRKHLARLHIHAAPFLWRT